MTSSQDSAIIPWKSLSIGTYKASNGSILFESRDTFSIIWVNNGDDKTFNVPLSEIQTIDQDLDSESKSISLTLKTSAELFDGFDHDQHNYRVTLKLCDDLNQLQKVQIDNFFSSVISNEAVVESPKRPKLSQPPKLENQEVVFEPKRNLRSRQGKTTYTEAESMDQDDQLDQAIALSLEPTKKTKNIVTPRRDEFAEFNDFQDLFVYQPSSDAVEITVRMEDYKCLDRRELITNTILDFYLQYIYHTTLSKELRERVHIFNSYFYSIYSTDSNFSGWKEDSIKTLTAVEKRYQRVQGLPTNDVNLFNKDFLVFPCLDNEHWFLTIVAYPRLNKRGKVNDVDGTYSCKAPVILCFDSVRGNPARRTKAIKHIRNFLDSEFKAKYQDQFAFCMTNLIGCHVASPQQKSATDCGLFVMEFFEHFFIKDPLVDFRVPIDRSTWFDPKMIENHEKRKQIAEIVKSMIVTPGISLPNISFKNFESAKRVIGLTSDDGSGENSLVSDKNNNEEKADNNNSEQITSVVQASQDCDEMKQAPETEKTELKASESEAQSDQLESELNKLNHKMNKSSNPDIDRASPDANNDMEGIVTSTTQQLSHDASNKAKQTYCGLEMASSDDSDVNDSEVIEIDDD